VTATSTEPAIAHRLRQGLLVVAALTVVGTTAELVMRHHWTQPVQLIAWVALALLVAAIVLLARNPSAGAVRVARILAGVVVAAAVIGMLEHIMGNHDAGPLDAQYGDGWDAMSGLSQWWAATIQAVGPSPALAPGVLIQGALCVLFATIGHPAIRPVTVADPGSGQLA